MVVMSDYNKLTVVELRAELKARGIAMTGLTRKQQLIERLEAHDKERTDATATATATTPASSAAAPSTTRQDAAEVQVEQQQHDNDDYVQQQEQQQQQEEQQQQHDEKQADTANGDAHAKTHLHDQESGRIQGQGQGQGQEHEHEQESGIEKEGEEKEEEKEKATSEEEMKPSQLQEENQRKLPEAQLIQPIDMAQKDNDQSQRAIATDDAAISTEEDSTSASQQPQQQPQTQSQAQPSIVPTNATTTTTTSESIPSTPSTTGTGEDSRKRKRRSSSPQPTASEIKKRLKQDSSDTIEYVPAVHLKEDHIMPSSSTQGDIKMADLRSSSVPDESMQQDIQMTAPPTAAPEEFSRTSQAEEATTTENQNEDEESGPQARPPPPQPLPNRESRDNRYKDLFPPRDISRPSHQAPTTDTAHPGGAEEDNDEDRDVEPAIHPATAALYIKNFMRPLQLPALKDHLISLARRWSQGGDNNNNQDASDIIQQIHLDAIKTHCFVVFSSVSAAARVRSSLHNRIWPQERTRKPLWVDFVPEDKVGAWIAEEEQSASGPGRRLTPKRWEVVYHQLDDGSGSVTASLQDAATSGVVGEVASRPTNVTTTTAAAGASLSERIQPPPSPVARRESRAERAPATTTTTTTTNTAAAAAKGGEASFLALDSLFKYTQAKPKLYYQPVSARTADRRLDALDGATSRRFKEDLASGVAYQHFANAADMRRFTFEEEDYLVDNGPEFGLRQGGRRPGGGGVRNRASRDGQPSHAPPPPPPPAPFAAAMSSSSSYKTGRYRGGGWRVRDTWRAR